MSGRSGQVLKRLGDSAYEPWFGGDLVTLPDVTVI